jgi:DNA-binding CsgD family transcriptional regulator
VALRRPILQDDAVLEHSAFNGDPLVGVGGLSPRERDVLALASRGLTNGQIAHQLALSVHGVKFHLGAIFRKLGVENRTAAAALYLSDPDRSTDPRSIAN